MMASRTFYFPMFVLSLLVYSAAFFCTISDYGVTWDSALGEAHLGDRVWAFWRTGDWSVVDVRRPFPDAEGDLLYAENAEWALRHPEHVWTLGPAVGAAARHLLFSELGWLSAADARHASLLGFAVLLFVSVFHFSRVAFGERTAFFSVLALMAYPRLLADMHNNLKDVPLTALWTLCLVTVFDAVRRANSALVLVGGIIGGLALSAKANAAFLPAVLLPWLLVLRWRSEQLPWSFARFLFWAFPSALLATLTFLITSPILLADFPDRVLAQMNYLFAFGALGPHGFQLLPAAQAVGVTPLAILILAIVGAFAMGRVATEEGKVFRAPMLVLVWLALPVLRVSLPRANDFDGIRHWMEFLPALAVLAGVGADYLIRALPGPALPKNALAAAAFLPAVIWSFFAHPYQITFFNSAVGGLGGARAMQFPQATDYWGSSYKKGIEWLNVNAEPNARIAVGVGAHIVRVQRPLLRPDLQIVPFGSTPLTLEPRYVMYITRTERYADTLEILDRTHPAVFHIDVDGAPILRILRIDPMQGHASS